MPPPVDYGQAASTAVYSSQVRAMCRPRFLRALAFALIFGHPASEAPAHAQEEMESVTREEAVRLALERSPADVGARGATRVAEAGVLEARGAWLPSLSANSTYANSSNERFDQSTGQLVSESYTAQLQTSYELFTGGRKLATWQDRK